MLIFPSPLLLPLHSSQFQTALVAIAGVDSLRNALIKVRPELVALIDAKSSAKSA